MSKLNFLELNQIVGDVPKDVLINCVKASARELSLSFDDTVDRLIHVLTQSSENILNDTQKSLSAIDFRAHQVEVAQKVLNNRTTIVCHDVGTGKTLTSILAFQAVLYREKAIPSSTSNEDDGWNELYVIILSPKALQQNMRNEMLKVGIDPDLVNMKTGFRVYNFFTYTKFAEIYFGVSISSLTNKRSVSYSTTINEVETRLEIGSRLLLEFGIPPLEKCCFVLDEAHKIRTDYTDIFSLFSNRKDRTFYSRAACVIECGSITYKNICLTATPMYNSVNNINNFLTLIYGENKPLPIERFNMIMNNLLTPQLTDFFESHFSFKIPSQEFYPDVIEKNVFLKMSQEYEDRYMEFQEAKEAETVNTDFGQSASNAFLGKMRQATNEIGEGIFVGGVDNPKVEYILDNFITSIECCDKVVICSNFISKGVQLIQSRIREAGENYLEVIGQSSEKAIERAIEIFNSDVDPPVSKKAKAMKKIYDDKSKAGIDQKFPRFLFISPAGGEGISLKGVRHLVLFDPSWNRNVDRQFEGRARRYMSHFHLPKDERNVTIHRLILCKRHNFDTFTNILSQSTDSFIHTDSIYSPKIDFEGSTRLFKNDVFDTMRTRKGLLKPSVELHLFLMGIDKDENIKLALSRLGKKE